MTSVMALAVKLALKDKDVTLGINAQQERKPTEGVFPVFVRITSQFSVGKTNHNY